MPEKPQSRQLKMLANRYPEFMTALEQMGQAARRCGPLDEKALHLVQLGAAAALGVEKAVCCHACGAVLAGAPPEAINQALLSLTPIIGFPAVAKALKWAERHLDE